MGDLLGFIGMAVLGAIAVAGVIFIAKLAFDAIKNWLNNSLQMHPNAEALELVKTKLANGNYKVVGGIFENGSNVESQSWECEKIDKDLKKEFGRHDRIVYDLRG